MKEEKDPKREMEIGSVGGVHISRFLTSLQSLDELRTRDLRDGSIS